MTEMASKIHQLGQRTIQSHHCVVTGRPFRFVSVSSSLPASCPKWTRPSTILWMPTIYEKDASKTLNTEYYFNQTRNW